MKEKQPCEAPNHAENCPCLTCVLKNCSDCRLITRDHFTSKAEAKVIGWKRKRINSDANIQLLSIPCHIQKDRNTDQITRQVRYQKQGGTIRFGEGVV